MPIPLIGYIDRFSARPGESIEVKVSSDFASPFEARLVRIRSGDPNPDRGGMKIIDLSDAFKAVCPSRKQVTALGSYGRVPHAPAFDAGNGPMTWSALIWPTLLNASRMTIMSRGDPAGQGGICLSLSSSGVAAEVATGNGTLTAIAAGSLTERTWYRVWMSADPSMRSLTVGCAPLVDDGTPETAATVTTTSSLRLDSQADFLVAASDGSGGKTAIFEGRIEAPTIFRSATKSAAAAAIPAPSTTVARYDFAVGIDGRDMYDRGPNALHGMFVNMPTRAVRGAFWTGKEMCWRHAPQDYAAVHFHADDLEDCGWDTSFAFTVPSSLKSGIYGFKLTCEGAEDIIPFYVRPADNGPRAKVLVIGSTYTFQAYANHLRFNFDDAFRKRVREWGAYPNNADDHHEFAHSTYNRHPDDTGVVFSSRLRPIFTMRPGYLTFNDARGSGLRHFPADTHLTDWLETKGIDYDVATDEDIDDDGVAALAPYKVVLTGSHPEYHTSGTLDAIQAYKAQGGRFCYLGGNGFYWRIARNPKIPHMIELRRAEGGIRAWAAEPGEYYHSTDGQYGGLWRRNMRPPQSIGGVGFSGQGLFEGSYYRRLPASHDPKFAWMFAGIADELLGDFGASGGGAAGFELDRADVSLGTPANAVILARSEKHQSHFVTVPEELLSHVHTLTGEKPDALVRAEIIYADLPKGGALFATGSITFCGSLGHNGGNNNVSRLLENVVRKMMA